MPKWIPASQRMQGAVVAELLSSWLAEQEDRGSIPGLATWIFRDWLSPASKSRYGWKIAKSMLILKTTNQPTQRMQQDSHTNVTYFHQSDILPTRNRFIELERKRKRSDSVLWQKPLHQQKCQKGKVTTQTTPQKSSIKQRLRTDLGRSVTNTSKMRGFNII